MNDLKGIIEDAIEEAGSVLVEVFESLEAPPPSQDQMREAFRLAMQSPENMMAFQQAFGEEAYNRQMQLALRRNRGDEW